MINQIWQNLNHPSATTNTTKDERSGLLMVMGPTAEIRKIAVKHGRVRHIQVPMEIMPDENDGENVSISIPSELGLLFLGEATHDDEEVAPEFYDEVAELINRNQKVQKGEKENDNVTVVCQSHSGVNLIFLIKAFLIIGNLG